MKNNILILFLFLFVHVHASEKSGMWYSRGNFYRIEDGIPDTTRYLGCNGMTGHFLEPYMGWSRIPEQWENISSPYKMLPGDSGIFIRTQGVDAWYNGNKWELLQINGKQVSPFLYDWIFAYQPTNPKTGKPEILFFVRQGEKWGVVNSSGKELIPIEYEIPIAEAFYNDSNLINQKEFGQRCREIMNDTNCSFFLQHDGVFRMPGINHSLIMMKDGKYGSVDTTNGKTLIPFIYEAINVGETGIYIVRKNGKYGYINDSAVEIIPCTYNFADPFFKQDNGEFEANAYDKHGCNIITITVSGKIEKHHAICDF